jgi:hypothetical protein
MLCTAVDFGERQGTVSALQQAERPAPVIAMHQISQSCQSSGVDYSTVMRARELGNPERWDKMIQKSLTGTARVAVLGGSVAAGHACTNNVNSPNKTCAWPLEFERMLAAEKMSVEVENLAAGGTSSRGGAIQALALGRFDAIIFHWTANDDGLIDYNPGDREHGIHRTVMYPERERADMVRRDYETLVRTALSLPQQPAVIVFDGLSWLLHMNGVDGMRENTRSEGMHRSVARVYDLPFISAHAAFWHQQQNQEDFAAHFAHGDPEVRIHFDRHESMEPRGDIHPKRSMHHRYACLVFESFMFQLAIASSQETPPSAMKKMQDIVPVFGGRTLSCDNTSSGSSSFDGTLQAAATKLEKGVGGGGWSYYADSGEKYGYISSTPNASLQFRFDLPAKQAGETTIFIHYLSSYTKEWGSVRFGVACVCASYSTGASGQGREEPCIPFEGNTSQVINSRSSEPTQVSQLAEHQTQIQNTDPGHWGNQTSHCTATFTNIEGKFKLLGIRFCNSNLLHFSTTEGVQLDGSHLLAR